MSRINIEKESLFLAYLNQGINLFTGAGFSVLPDLDGSKLPTGPEYADELINKFALQGIVTKLDDVADVAPYEELQRYTRQRFLVTTINSKYEVLNRVTLKSFITTNYDNIPSLIFKDNPRYRLYDVRTGPHISDSLIPYVPIHGNVLNDAYEIVIGALKVLDNTEHTSQTVQMAKQLVNENPTLIWGYGLQDPSALQIFNTVLRKKKDRVWILCHNGDFSEEQKNYYHLMGCNFIIGDTDSLLDWINENLSEVQDHIPITHDPELKKYVVPAKLGEVYASEISDYYKLGKTTWYHILTDVPYERDVVGDIAEAGLKGNVIICGQRFSGKTTILSQVAVKIPKVCKYYFKSITSEFVDLLISKVKDIECWFFIDNCPNLHIIQKLSANPKIHIVAVVNELLYESEKFFLKDLNVTVFNITEFSSKLEAEKIFEKIPREYRKNLEFSYKDTEEEKYSMIELVSKNLDSPLSKTVVERILKNIAIQSSESIELIALTVYLSDRSSALTTDLIMAYFGLTNYDSVQSKIDKVNSLLRNIGQSLILEPDELNQDYYSIRSGLFLNRALDLFETKSPTELREVYGKMITNFVEKVSPLRIWRFEEFRKREYDAELFYKVFSDKNHVLYLYDELYQYSHNPYVLQQKALYYRRCKMYREAFDEIVIVKKMLPKNASVKNSYAMILFEMSDTEPTDEALKRMKKAMRMLEDLHEIDYRKRYHTIKYADYAIKMCTKYKLCSYLKNAMDWLIELELTSNDVTSRISKIKNLQISRH